MAAAPEFAHITDRVLVFVGIGQLILLGVQARILDRQATVADQQRRLMEAQAGISNEQRELMAVQTTISKRQIELEERRFFAEFRPRLIITNTWISAPKDVHPTIHFTVLNIGETEARIGALNVACQIYGIGKVSMAVPIAATGTLYVPHTLRPGMSVGTQYTFQDVPLTIAFHERDREDLTVLSGTVIYFETNSSRPYHLGFSREMRGLSPVCTVSENSEREYSY